MRKVTWSLLPLLLIAGAALGYFVKSSKTKTVTVVEIQTVEKPPLATQALTAKVSIEGTTYDAQGNCQLPSAGFTGLPASSDSWDLRRPGNDGSSGDVIGVSNGAEDAGCGALTVKFRINPKAGFFVVYDENVGVHWGPFDSAALSSDGWRLNLTYNH
jgi:hypothetical protein